MLFRSASDRRAVFVGLDAYEAAGGVVLRDLFQSDDGGWLDTVLYVLAGLVALFVLWDYLSDDAARKALAAVLAHHGLRARPVGVAHVNTGAAAAA